VPVVIVLFIALGFFKSGSSATSSCSSAGCCSTARSPPSVGLCMPPLTIVFSFLMAPVATLNPFVGVGLFAGLAEAFLRKAAGIRPREPRRGRVQLQGFYKNRVTKILLIFFLSSIGA